MAVSLEQMAGAYVQYVRQEIDILNKVKNTMFHY